MFNSTKSFYDTRASDTKQSAFDINLNAIVRSFVP
jgi:hypothetical protein